MLRTSIPRTKLNRSILEILLDEGMIQSWSLGSRIAPFEEAKIQNQRLWIDFKYRQGQAVLTKVQLISKGSRKVFATPEELQGMPRKLGQITVIKTKTGVFELNDCIGRGLGGEVLMSAV